MPTRIQTRRLLAAAAAFALIAGAGQAFAGSHGDAPVIEHTQGDAALRALPRLPPSQRKVVTIYNFRSGVPGVQNAAATDMFIDALMQSGAFLVVERQQGADVTAERALNMTGAQHGLVAAQLIFEGAISESNPAQDERQNSFSIGGMEIDRGSQKGKIVIDVRVVDPDTGLVLDSVVVGKVIRANSSSLLDVGSLASSIAGLSGRSIPLAPDLSTQSTHNDGVDEAIRACIGAAVVELARRYAAN